MVLRFISMLRREYFREFQEREARRLALDAETDLLRRSETWSENELREYQSERLRALLVHCLSEVPLYESLSRTLLGAAANEQMDPFEVLAHFPIIKKETLIDRSELLIARNLKSMSWYRNQTGGSTGEPVHFVQTRHYARFVSAQIERNFRWCGFESGMALAYVWGSDRDAAEHIGWRARLRNFRRSNILWINAFDLSVDEVIFELGLLALFSPGILTGYVSSLSLLAQVAGEIGEERVRPLGVQTTAEVLTRDHRALIEGAFGAPVFDRYGCREVGNIAHECEAHEGLHVLGESNVVEIMDPHEDIPLDDGGFGRVVVTNLDNFAQPFVRYEVGDLAEWVPGRCSCGRTHSRLRIRGGRIGENITGPSGRVFHSEFFTHLFYRHQGIRRFQVEQEAPHRLVIRVVPGPGYDREGVARKVMTDIVDQGDPGFEVSWLEVEKIPNLPSGKFRFVFRSY